MPMVPMALSAIEDPIREIRTVKLLFLSQSTIYRKADASTRFGSAELLFLLSRFPTVVFAFRRLDSVMF